MVSPKGLKNYKILVTRGRKQVRQEVGREW